MPGPVVTTVLHDIRHNLAELQVAEALGSYRTGRALALRAGLPEDAALEVARRAIAAARDDHAVPARPRSPGSLLPPWLREMRSPAGFADCLATRQSLDFARWLAARAGPDGVLGRNSFDLRDIEPWLAHLTILQRDPSTGQFRYRLFGAEPAAVLGRDLTGLTLDAWPSRIARVKRDRLHTLVTRRIPVVVHSARMRFEDGVRRRGTGVLEQFMWPMRYGDGEPDAVIDLTAMVPDPAFDADRLRRETGRITRHIAADGRPLEAAPRAEE